MFGIERLQAIRELVKEKKSVEVTYLSQELDVSEVTIRRDLDKLEKEGLVAKTYGGAILIDHGINTVDKAFDTEVRSETLLKNEYMDVAKTAAKLIESGDTVFIGGSTMGISLVQCLKDFESLIAVTNNLEIAMYLFKETNHKIVIIGGELDSASGNVLEFDQFDELLIEKSFIAVDGIDKEFGYTVNEKSDVRLYKRLKSVTRNLILVAAGDVFNKRGLVKMAPLEAIENVVTEKSIPDEFKSFYYEHNVKVYTSMLQID